MSEQTVPGTICHVEIPAPDLEKAKTFFREQFGWTIHDNLGPTYCLWSAGGLGGGFSSEMAVVEGGLNVILAVDDIPGKLEAIARAGGKSVQGKTEIGGGHGFFALFKDPNGNRLGLWSKT
ncbi:MAG: VOC family protein [Planctomycetota bacterium]|nr:VOC family protein [Planctomycetota bacterium]